MSHAAATLPRLPLYVAIQNDYFEEEGVELEFVDTRSGSDAMMMPSGGAVNISTGQLLDAINVKRQGIELRGVAMLTQRLTNSITVRKDVAGEIKSIADMAGRPFGITGVGSGTWQFAVYMGSLEGLAVEDFNFIGVGAGANVLGALTSGRVDAMSYADPENLMLVEDGEAEFLINMSDDAAHRELIGDTYLTNQVMALQSFIDKSAMPSKASSTPSSALSTGSTTTIRNRSLVLSRAIQLIRRPSFRHCSSPSSAPSRRVSVRLPRLPKRPSMRR